MHILLTNSRLRSSKRVIYYEVNKLIIFEAYILYLLEYIYNVKIN